MKRILLRMRNGKLARTYLQWSSRAKLFSNQRETLERIMRRIKSIHMAGAYDRWSSQVANVVRQRDVFARVILRMENATASAALNRWKGKVQEEKELSFKGHKIVLRWKMKYLSIAFEKLKIHCNEMKRTRLVLARMLNQALSGAFYTWHVIIKRQVMRMSVIVSRSLQLQAESHARRLQVCQKISFEAHMFSFFF